VSALEPVADRRAIVDRRTIAERIAGMRAGKRQFGQVSEILREALASGRGEIARRLSEEPGRGRAAARATAFLHDQIVRLAYDSVAPEMPGIALVGLGGTGRGEMAPYSDVDLMFLTAVKPSRDDGNAAEAVLHLLWDLKLKVGHSLRSVGELVEKVGMHQPGVSRHLKVLRDAGLVEVRRDAQRRLYRLRPEPLMELDAWLEPYRLMWTSSLNDLERHLDLIAEARE